MAQRLVRRLCAECCVPDTRQRRDLPADFPFERMQNSGRAMYSPVGCPACRGSGYKGRVGIYELLTCNDEIRELVTNRATSTEIKRAARREGMATLREDGWNKAMNGVTSIDEVLRVTKAD